MDQVFTTHGAAEILKVHPFTVSKWMDRGFLKSFKTAGGHRRTYGADIRRYLLEKNLPIPRELESDRTKLQIIVVDDDQLVLNGIRRAFKAFSEEVELTMTTSGVQALLLLSDLRPDGMLIDINMPELDGLEVIRRVRGFEPLAATRLIAMSSIQRQSTFADALKAGAAAALVKPFNPAEVIALVRRGAVKNQRSHRARRATRAAYNTL